ncbi:histidine-type phosphatase [archaeon]|nr:MAG: histidine-type phosphatase [archaeon]
MRPNGAHRWYSYVKTPTKELKVKSKSGLLRFLEVTRQVIQDKSIAPELRRKLYQIRDVLERWEISGINRKLQMKPLKWEEEEEEETISEPTSPLEDISGRMVYAESCADLTLPICYSSNSTSLKISKGKDKDGKDKDGKDKDGKEKKYRMATEILIILKWGGDLTPLGREQAENLGAKFRTEHYPESDNGGVLRLHATYRHDLKIKASDEGRVIKTAAAFTKGLLALEGQLTPIISSLVTMEEKNRQMLDRGGNFEMKEEMDRCKEHLNLLQVDKEIDDQLIDELVPECSLATRTAFKELGNPLQLLKRMHYLISRLTTQLEMICVQQYAYYEAQVEAQLLAEQQAASTTANTHNSSICSSVDPNDTISTPGGGTRERTASSSSVNMNSAIAHNSMAIDNDIPSYNSTSNTPRPMMMENNMQYIELGAPEPSPPNPSAGNGAVGLSGVVSASNLTTVASVSTTPADPDANIFPSSNPTSITPVAGEVEGNSIHKIDLNSSEPSEIDLNSIAPIELYLQETCDLMWDRWDKLYRDFYNNKKSQYDLTKVPDVYDMIRYDILHNSSLGLTGMEELFQLASKFERCVVPQEYGTDKEDKRYIGSKMCGALLEKIKHDLTVATSMNSNNGVDPMLYQLDQSHAEDLRINSMTRCVRTRLYFTSESHLHTVLNVLRCAKPNSPYSLSKEGLEALEQITDVSYLSQIIIRLFQDRFDSEKYACEIIFSSGTSNEITGEKRGDIAQYVVLEKSIALQQLMGLLGESIDLYQSTREERLMAEGESQQVVVPENPLDAPMENVTDVQETHTPEAIDPNAPHDPAHHTPSPGHARAASTHVSPTAASSTHYTTHSPHHGSHHYYSSHLHGKRSTSITVNMDELNSLTSDRWENSAPKSNTKTFMASRSYSMHGLPGHIKVPKPLSLHPTYVGLMDDDEGLLLGNTPKGVSNNSYYTAFKARRTYNPNPMMKSYTEQFMRKSSPSTPTSMNTAKMSVPEGVALPSKTLDALNLTPSSRTASGANSPAKFEGRNKKGKEGCNSATSSTSNSPSGTILVSTASLQSEKDNSIISEVAPVVPKRKESFSMEKLPMQPTIMETGNVVMDGGTAEESTAPTMLVGTKDKTVVVETPVRKIKVVEVADHEHLNTPSLAEVTAAATALSSGRSSPSLTNISSNGSVQTIPVPADEVTGKLQEVALSMSSERKPIGIADTGEVVTPSKVQAADADAEI